MSVKSFLAKAVPLSVAQKHIDADQYNGDDWHTVSTIVSCMSRIKPAKEGGVEFFYNDKKVGWAKSDGSAWCDREAYAEMRKAYDELSNKASKESKLEEFDEFDFQYLYGHKSKSRIEECATILLFDETNNDEKSVDISEDL